jgi:16S rRNA C1402 (ribose-2'-O) methylase RsmI
MQQEANLRTHVMHATTTLYMAGHSSLTIVIQCEDIRLTHQCTSHLTCTEVLFKVKKKHNEKSAVKHKKKTGAKKAWQQGSTVKKKKNIIKQ